MAPIIEPLEIRLVPTTISLTGPGDLLIESFGSASDLLSIHADNANSQFVVSDPGQSLFTNISGATNSGPNMVLIPFSSVPNARQLIVNTFDSDDVIHLTAAGTDFFLSPMIDGGDGFDVIDSSAPVSVTTTNVDVQWMAEDIRLEANLTTTGGKVTLNGHVVINSDVSISTSNGDVMIFGQVDSGAGPSNYTLFSTPRSYDDALMQAALDVPGGYLATIRSSGEQDVVQAVVGSNDAWLGATDRDVQGEGEWYWDTEPGGAVKFWSGDGITGNSVGGEFTNWQLGDPDSPGGTPEEDAAFLRGSDPDGVWLDGDVTIARPYVVESPSLFGLTINAGSGMVKFNGSLGNSLPLRSLSVTAGQTQLFGGTVRTTKDQAYNSAVGLLGSMPTLLRAEELNFNGGVASVTGVSSLILAPAKRDAPINVGGATDAGVASFDITDTDLAALAAGFATVFIGKQPPPGGLSGGVTGGGGPGGGVGSPGISVGPVTVTSSIFLNPVVITGGSISVTELNAGTNRVTLIANTDSITDGGSVGADVTAGELLLDSFAGIGTSSDALDTTVGEIAARAVDHGGVFIANTGNLLIGPNGAPGGAFANVDTIRISSIGAMTVNQPIQSKGGDVNLIATNGITINGVPVETRGIDVTGGQFTADADSDNDGVGTFTIASIIEFVDWATSNRGLFADGTTVNITTTSLATATAQVSGGDTRFSDGEIYFPPQPSGDVVVTSFAGQNESVTFSFLKPQFGLFLHFDGMQQGTAPATVNPINLYAFDQLPFKVSGESTWDVDESSFAIRQLSGNHLADQDGTVRFGQGLNSLTLSRNADGVSPGNESIVNVQLGLLRAGGIMSGGGAVTIRAADVELGGFVNADSGLVSLIPSGTNRTVDLGATGGSGQFILTDTELDSIFAASGIVIGNTSTGKMTINDTITRSDPTNLTLTVANNKDIQFLGSSARLNVNGGNVSLTTGGTGAILSGDATDEIRAASVSLAAGSGGIGENSNPLTLRVDSLNSSTTGNADQFVLLNEANAVTIGTAGLNAGTGTIFLDSGVLKLDGSNSINDASALAIGSSATFELDGFNETLGGLSDFGSVINSTAIAASLTINNSGDFEFGGTLGDTAGLGINFSLTKSGSGTLTLSGTNSYSGTTTINGGTLLVTGAIASATTVSNVGTLGGSGTINGSVTVNGGTVAPGNSPGILNTGDFAYIGSGTLSVEVNGSSPGTQHDQVNVTGTVTPGTAAISFSGTITSEPGQLVVLVNNDGTEAISGVFGGLAEGGTVTINGVDFVFSSRGGTGNDVTLTEVGTLTFVGSRFDDSFELREATIGGSDYLQFVMGGQLIDQRLSASVTGISIAGDEGNDTLTIDYGGSGGFFNKLVTFNGGDPISGLGDSLILTGGSFTSITHLFTNASDGSIEIDGSMAVSYTGLEPIIDNLSATDRVFTFSSAAETITLNDASGSEMTIDSTNSESVTFTNPSVSLTINAGAGNDAVTISSVNSNFQAAVTINGGAGADTATLDTNLALGAGILTSSVLITAETINLNANIRTDLGSNAGPIGLNGAVQLGANVSLDSSSAFGGDGNITFGGTIDGSHNLTTDSRGAATTFNGAVGGSTALTDLDVTADTINLSANINTDGGSLTFTGNSVLENSISIDTEQGNDNSGGSVIFSGGLLRAAAANIDLTINTNSGGTDSSGAVSLAGTDNNVVATRPRHLTINAANSGVGPAGDVTFTGALSLAFSGNLIVDGRSILLTTSNSDLTTNGSGVVTFNATQNIDLSSDSSIRTVNGNLTLNANTSGTTTGDFIGIRLFQASVRTIGTGSINLLARSGDAGDRQYGILLDDFSLLEATGAGEISLFGESRGTSGPENDGILIASESDILSNSGQIILRGIRGVGSTAEGIGMTVSGITISTTSAPIFLLADVIDIGHTRPVISAGSGNVIFLRPITPGTAIGLGAASSSDFSLSDAQLDRLTSGALQIGDTDSGTITISDNITRPSATSLSLITGGNNSIVFSGSSATLDSNNGDVTLTLNTAGTGAITSGGALKDVRGVNVSLTSGSGGIGANGNPVITDASTVTAATNGNAPMFLAEIDGATITPAGLSAGTGTISLTGGTFKLGGADRINDNSPLSIAAGATFALNGFAETFSALSGNGSIINGSATAALLLLNAASSLSFSGRLGGNGTNDNNFALTKTGNGTLTLSGTNTFTGDTAVNAGTLLLLGSLTSDVTVASGAILGGTGTINSNNKLTVKSGGTVAPGSSPGILNTSDLTLQPGSALSIELNGRSAGIDYDQVNVTGTVTIASNVTLNSSLGFSPSAGDTFVIINNDGSDAISGTFNSLPQGTLFSLGGSKFHLFYNHNGGGDGNNNDAALIVNRLPVVNDQAFSISESNGNGASVGTVTATDADTSVTYSITAGNSLGVFAINTATGEITVNDASNLDAESHPSFTLTTTVTDDAGAADTAIITINLINAAPSTPSDGDTAANSVSEGASNNDLVEIDADSSDIHGGTVTFSLTDDAGGRFAINGSTGVVRVANASLLNFENATSHSITVQASDGAATSNQSFTIAVTNVAPTTPIDTDNAADSVSEGASNNDLVGIDADSSDVHGGTVTFSLTDNAGGRFAINSSTGVVRVAIASLLNFENATSHSITVQASDGAATSTQSFTIAVSNVAPTTLIDTDNTANSVSEGASNNDLVGIDADSSDVHGGAVTFSLTNDAGGRFAINSSTGVVRVADASLLNFENSTSHSITVQASDGTATTSQNFTIAVTNVAPTTPIDTDAATNTVTEGAVNGDLVGINADSSDVHGGAITFSLTNDAGGRFAIDSRNGVVTVADVSLLDFSRSNSQTIVVQASDGTTSSSQSFTINVFGAAPDAPLDIDDHVNTIPEGALEGSRVGITLSSTDPQGEDVFYRLTDDAGGRFAIDPFSGVVTVKVGRLLVFNDARQYSFSAVAVDASGNASLATSFVVNVTQVPVNALALVSILPTRNSVVEGDSGPNFITFLVKLNKPSAETITVDFATRRGDDRTFQLPEGITDDTPFASDTPGVWDFFRSTGQLTFDPGVTEQPLRVQIRPDNIAEPNELFFVQLQSPVNVKLAAQQSIAIAKLLDDDSAPQLVVSNTQVLEGDSAGQNELVFTVQLIGDLPPGTATASADYFTGNIAIDSAIAGTDYTAISGTLTFTNLDRLQEVHIPILGDTVNESDKTVSLRFQNPVNLGLSRPGVIGTIINDDSPNVVVSISPHVLKLREGNSGSQQAEFIVTLIGKPTGTVSVNYTTSDQTATAGSDYLATSGTVDFSLDDIANGIVQKSIFVAVLGDTNIELDETFSVALALPATSLPHVSIDPDLAVGKVVIRNDDQAILTEDGDALAVSLSGELTTILGNGPKSNPALIAALRARALDIIRTQGLTKAIVIIIDPVDFVLTDTEGRQAGYTASTGVVNEIPGAYYSGDGAVELLIVPLPPDGTYNVQLAGLGGDFNASITVLDNNGTSTDIVSQSLSDGATSRVAFQVGGTTIPVGLGLASANAGASTFGVVGNFGQAQFRLALASVLDQATFDGFEADDLNSSPSDLMSWLTVSARAVRQRVLDPLWQSLESPLGDLLNDVRLKPRSIPAEFVDQFWSQLGQTLTGVPSSVYRLGDMLEGLIPTLLPGRNRPTTPRPGEQGQPNPAPNNGVRARRSSIERPRTAPNNAQPQPQPQNKPKAANDKSAQAPEPKRADNQQSSTTRTGSFKISSWRKMEDGK